MDNSISSLERIASSLEKHFSQQHEFIVGLLIAFIAAIIAAYLANLSSKFLKLWEESRGKEIYKINQCKQKKLLTALLGDEISLRWNSIIGKDMREIFTIENTIEKTEKLYSTEFHTNDLYVFDQCANNFQLISVLGDEEVVSHVIHVHQLAKDLQEGLEQFRNLIETPQSYFDVKLSEKTIESKQDQLKTMFNLLDHEILKIYKLIQNEYEKIVNDHQYILTNPDYDDIIKKISDIADRRLASNR